MEGNADGRQSVEIAATPVLELLPQFPIVLVSTRANVLTVNQVHYFTFAPLRLGVAIARVRHSWQLIDGEGEFVVNVPGPNLLEAVKACGRLSGRDGDKFGRARLTPVPSREVAAVAVGECGAHIECRVTSRIGFEERTWFIGDVVAADRSPDHDGSLALTCGRHDYRSGGEIAGPRWSRSTVT
jgi:flavin reductase (DIM6/NTAB) family NADH-FMN oxidoreductase RutF